MSRTPWKGPTRWLAAILIAAAFAAVKLDLFGAGTFIQSNGRWAAGIAMLLFVAILAIGLHSLGRGESDGDSSENTPG